MERRDRLVCRVWLEEREGECSSRRVCRRVVSSREDVRLFSFSPDLSTSSFSSPAVSG